MAYRLEYVVNDDVACVAYVVPFRMGEDTAYQDIVDSSWASYLSSKRNCVSVSFIMIGTHDPKDPPKIDNIKPSNS